MRTDGYKLSLFVNIKNLFISSCTYQWKLHKDK